MSFQTFQYVVGGLHEPLLLYSYNSPWLLGAESFGTLQPRASICNNVICIHETVPGLGERGPLEPDSHKPGVGIVKVAPIHKRVLVAGEGVFGIPRLQTRNRKMPFVFIRWFPACGGRILQPRTRPQNTPWNSTTADQESEPCTLCLENYSWFVGGGSVGVLQPQTRNRNS